MSESISARHKQVPLTAVEQVESPAQPLRQRDGHLDRQGVGCISASGHLCALGRVPAATGVPPRRSGSAAMPNEASGSGGNPGTTSALRTPQSTGKPKQKAASARKDPGGPKPSSIALAEQASLPQKGSAAACEGRNSQASAWDRNAGNSRTMAKSGLDNNNNDDEVSMAELDACLAAGSASIEVVLPVAAAAAPAAAAAVAPCSAAAAAAVVSQSQAGQGSAARCRIARASPGCSWDGGRRVVRCQSPMELCIAVQSAQKQKRAVPLLAGGSPVTAAGFRGAIGSGSAAAAAPPLLRTPPHGGGVMAAGAKPVTPGSAQVRLQLPEACPVQSIRAAAAVDVQGAAAAAVEGHRSKQGAPPAAEQQLRRPNAVAARDEAAAATGAGAAAAAVVAPCNKAPARVTAVRFSAAEAPTSAHRQTTPSGIVATATAATPAATCAAPGAPTAIARSSVAPPSTTDTNASLTIAQLAVMAAARTQEPTRQERVERTATQPAAAGPVTTDKAAAADEDAAAAGALQLSGGDDGDNGAVSPAEEQQQQPQRVRDRAAVVSKDTGERAQRRAGGRGGRGGRRGGAAGGRGRRASAASAVAAEDRSRSVTPPPTLRRASQPMIDLADSGDESSPDVPIGKLAAATAAATVSCAGPSLASLAAAAPAAAAVAAAPAAEAPAAQRRPQAEAPAAAAATVNATVTPAVPNRRVAAAKAAAAIAAMAAAARTPVRSSPGEDASSKSTESPPGSSAESSPDLPIGLLVTSAATTTTATTAAAATDAAASLAVGTDTVGEAPTAADGAVAGVNCKSGSKRKRQSPEPSEPQETDAEAQEVPPGAMKLATAQAKDVGSCAPAVAPADGQGSVAAADPQLHAPPHPPHEALPSTAPQGSSLTTAAATATAVATNVEQHAAAAASGAGGAAGVPGGQRVQLGALWKRQRTGAVPPPQPAATSGPLGPRSVAGRLLPRQPGGAGGAAAAQRSAESQQQQPHAVGADERVGGVGHGGTALDMGGMAPVESKRDERVTNISRQPGQDEEAALQQQQPEQQQQEQKQQEHEQQQESKQQAQESGSAQQATTKTTQEQQGAQQMQDLQCRVGGLPGTESTMDMDANEEVPLSSSQPGEEAAASQPPPQEQEHTTSSQLQPQQQQQPARAHIRSAWKRPRLVVAATPPSASRAAGPGRRAALLSRAGGPATQAATAAAAAPTAELLPGCSQPGSAAAADCVGAVDDMQVDGGLGEMAAVDGECSIRLQVRQHTGSKLDLDTANEFNTDACQSACNASSNNGPSKPPTAATTAEAAKIEVLYRTPPRPTPARRLPGAGPSAVYNSPTAAGAAAGVGAALVGSGGMSLGKPPRSPGDARVSLSPSPRMCPSPSPSSRGPPGGSGHRLRDPSLHPSAMGTAAGTATGASVLLGSRLASGSLSPSSSPLPKPNLGAAPGRPPSPGVQPRSPTDGGSGGGGLGFLQPLAPIRTKIEAAAAAGAGAPAVLVTAAATVVPAAAGVATAAVAPAVGGVNGDPAEFGVQSSIVRAVEALLAVPLVTLDDDSPVCEKGESPSGAHAGTAVEEPAVGKVLGVDMTCRGSVNAAAAVAGAGAKDAVDMPTEGKGAMRGSLDRLLEAAATTHGSAQQAKEAAASLSREVAMVDVVPVPYTGADADASKKHVAASSGQQQPKAQPAPGTAAAAAAAHDAGGNDPPSAEPKPLRSALRSTQPFFSAPGNWAAASHAAPSASLAPGVGRVVAESCSLVCEERLDGGGTPSRGTPSKRGGLDQQGKAASPLPPRPRPAGSRLGFDPKASPLGRQATRPLQPSAPGQFDSPIQPQQRTPDGYSTPPCTYTKSRLGHAAAPASGGGASGGGGPSSWPRSVSYPGQQYDMMIEDVVQQMLNEASPDPLPPLELGPTAGGAASTGNTNTGAPGGAAVAGTATAIPAVTAAVVDPSKEGVTGVVAMNMPAAAAPASSHHHNSNGTKGPSDGADENGEPLLAVNGVPHHHAGHAELSPSRCSLPPPRRRSIYLPSPTQPPQSLKRRRLEELEEPDGSVTALAASASNGAANSAVEGLQAGHVAGAPGEPQQQRQLPAGVVPRRRRPRKAARVEGGSGGAVGTAAGEAAVASSSDRMDTDDLNGAASGSDAESEDDMIGGPGGPTGDAAASAASNRVSGTAVGPAVAVPPGSSAGLRAGGGGAAVRGSGAATGPQQQQAPSVFAAGRTMPYSTPGGGNWMKPGLAWGRTAAGVAPGAHHASGPAVRSSPQLMRPSVAGPSRPSPASLGTAPAQSPGLRASPVGSILASPAVMAARNGAAAAAAAGGSVGGDPGGSPGDALFDVPRVLSMPRGSVPSKRQNSYLSAASLEAATARPTIEQVYREAFINARLAQAWAEGERWARCDLAGLPVDMSKRGLTERLAMLEAATANLNCYRGAEGAAKIMARIEGEWVYLKRIRTAAATRTSARTPSGATPSPALFCTAGAGEDAATRRPPHTPLPFASLTQAAAVGAAAAADRQASAEAAAAAASGGSSGVAGAAVAVAAGEAAPVGEKRTPAAAAAVSAIPEQPVDSSSQQMQSSDDSASQPQPQQQQPPPEHQQQPQGASQQAPDASPLPKPVDAASAAAAEGFGTPLLRAPSGEPPADATPPVAAPGGATSGVAPASLLAPRFASQQQQQQQQQLLTPPPSILKAAPTPIAVRGFAAVGFAAPVMPALTPGCGAPATGGKKAVKFAAVLELGPQSGYRQPM